MIDPISQTAEFSFKLTRWQVICNPIERLCVVVISFLGCAGLGVMAGIHFELSVKWLIQAAVSVAAICCFHWMYRGPYMTLRRNVVEGLYLNTIKFAHDSFYCGVDGNLFLRGPRFPLHLARGVAGTYVIRCHPYGFSWTLPETVAPFDDLKRLVEKKPLQVKVIR